MLRIIFFLVILVHGLIHLLGFLKAFGLSNLDQLQQPVSKPVGALWLAAALVLILTAAAFLLRKEWWWMPALPAVALSQVLILLAWQDTKFGTIANILILVVCLISYGDWSFGRSVSKVVEELVPTRFISAQQVTPEMLNGLPPLVQTWMRRSHLPGASIPQWGRLQQTGQMKIKPGSRWMPVVSRQWILYQPAGFVWEAQVGQGSLMQFSGRDLYSLGRGEMTIKLFSLFPLVEAEGEPINKGALVRYLAEVVWFPWAALNRNIKWETLDESRVKATFTDAGITVSGIFTFNEQGDVIKFEASRYFYRKSGSTPEKWTVAIDGNSYQQFGGIRIPASSTVSWELDGEEFTWYRVTVADAHYY